MLLKVKIVDLKPLNFVIKLMATHKTALAAPTELRSRVTLSMEKKIGTKLDLRSQSTFA